MTRPDHTLAPTSTLVAVLVVSAVALALPGAARAAAAPRGELTTSFLLLTGSPDPTSGDSAGVLMVPGTVIPVTSGEGRPKGTEDVQELLTSGRATTELASKLRTTMRLADIQVQYSQDELLALDAPTELPPATPGSSVRPEVTLLGLTDEVATFRVVFRDGSNQLSETNVGIPLGRRTVVGALDGPEAPYVFLVVEPSSMRPLVVDSNADITPPRRIAGPAPSYTEEARKNRLQGVVIIQAVIGEDGRVSHTRVLKGLGMGLDRASEEAVSQWRFEPARRDGEPVTVFYNMTVNFRLEDEESGKKQGA